MSDRPDRTIRADAQRNHDKLLEAAARAFARDGTEASLKAIAQDAGVGIATLYRRFGTRERLVEATYRHEVERVSASPEALLRSRSAADALAVWMERFVGLLAVKHGMADTLRVILAGTDEMRLATRERLTAALAVLLEAGAADGTLRPDADPTDVLMALGGIALIAGRPEQRDQALRLQSLLLDGVRRGARATA
jgi:AcrR family transcriptional regulator